MSDAEDSHYNGLEPLSTRKAEQCTDVIVLSIKQQTADLYRILESIRSAAWFIVVLLGAILAAVLLN